MEFTIEHRVLDRQGFGPRRVPVITFDDEGEYYCNVHEAYMALRSREGRITMPWLRRAQTAMLSTGHCAIVLNVDRTKVTTQEIDEAIAICLAARTETRVLEAV